MTMSLSPVFLARTPSAREPFVAGGNGLELVVEMAHDLRSPLSAILVLAETMLGGASGPLTDNQRHQMSLIYNAALSLCTTASDVVEVANGGGQLVERSPRAFVVSEVLEAVADMVRPIAEQKGLHLIVTPPQIDNRLGHSRALSRLLLNLATNAVKYTERGFVEIAGRETLDGRVEFSVTDTGPGLHATGADDPARERSGTGLGLLICRKLSAAMGSDLHVESRAGQGTRFHFVLELPVAGLVA